ncbi:MAG: M16 family metallopeptidase [Gammaproteobacteria bacterium]|tara:strand:- start:5628 stop:6947 length:1320 start_codon:yes stop_codon:yes gene_type:complete
MKKIQITYFLIIMMLPNITQANIEISEYETSNGIKVLYSKSENIPMIDIKITFDAGSNRDGNLKGLSMLTHNLLDEGTTKLSAEEIASSFESTGAVFNTSVNKDKSSISLRSLADKKYLGPSLKTFLNILSDSTFPLKELSLQKDRTVSNIIEDESDPSDISMNLFFKEIYKNYAYGYPSIGEKSIIKNISRKDIVNFYKNNLNQKTAKIAIVSSLPKKDVEALSEKISKSLERKNILVDKNTIQLKKDNKEKYIYKKFNSKQAHIYIGGLAIKRGAKNHLPLYVGNYIFGGSGFSARLMQELRVKRGYTYGVYSYIYPMKNIGPFVIGIETKSEQAQISVELIHNMLQEFIENGPTNEEIKHAKEAIINGFPLRVDSNSDILNYLSMINYYDLPMDYLAKFTENISKITKKDIISAFKEEIDYKNLTTLVVGNEKAKK